MKKNIARRILAALLICMMLVSGIAVSIAEDTEIILPVAENDTAVEEAVAEALRQPTTGIQ